MKKYFYSFFILAFVFLVCGCQSNKTRVGAGAGIGGTVGAIAGGIIGFQSGEKKLQLGRENQDASGEWRFSKLGRMTKAEVQAIVPVMTKAVDSM